MTLLDTPGIACYCFVTMKTQETGRELLRLEPLSSRLPRIRSTGSADRRFSNERSLGSASDVLCGWTLPTPLTAQRPVQRHDDSGD